MLNSSNVFRLWLCGDFNGKIRPDLAWEEIQEGASISPATTNKRGSELQKYLAENDLLDARGKSDPAKIIIPTFCGGGRGQ